MSKVPNKTSYYVSLKDGSSVKVCCGPAILALGDDVQGYTPLYEEKVQCQYRPDSKIEGCPVRRMRAEAKKSIEKRITVLRSKAANLNEEADELERRINK